MYAVPDSYPLSTAPNQKISASVIVLCASSGAGHRRACGGRAANCDYDRLAGESTGRASSNAGTLIGSRRHVDAGSRLNQAAKEPERRSIFADVAELPRLAFRKCALGVEEDSIRARNGGRSNRGAHRCR
jgi:hypothetical protein